MNVRAQMDRIYREVSPDNIPWNLTEPPSVLTDAVTSGRILPCRAVDLGCGTGNYAVWLAAQGFNMTGFDISPEAVRLATQLAVARGVECRFQALDLLGDVSEIANGFDFAYDWEVLHHVFPGDRPAYVANAYRLLRPQGRYLSVCFAESDPAFGGEGKFRQTPLGTTLYFSSESELTELLAVHFEIEELSTREIPGKHAPHQAVVAWLRPKK